jgi:hypothetical protein
LGRDKAAPPVLVQAPEIGIQGPSPIAARLAVLSAAVRQGLADSTAAVVDSIAEAVDSIAAVADSTAAAEAGPVVAEAEAGPIVAAEAGPVVAAADAGGSLRTEGEARGPRQSGDAMISRGKPFPGLLPRFSRLRPRVFRRNGAMLWGQPSMFAAILDESLDRKLPRPCWVQEARRRKPGSL